jgi:hypothetical protein
VRQVSERGCRRVAEGRLAWRRGWPALLALLLLVTGSGLGAAGGLAQALRGAPQAGAGTADSRDPALLRHAGRHAVLVQRTADPALAPAPVEPGLLPEPFAALSGNQQARPSGPSRAAGKLAALPRPYQARAPPPAA